MGKLAHLTLVPNQGPDRRLPVKRELFKQAATATNCGTALSSWRIPKSDLNQLSASAKEQYFDRGVIRTLVLSPNSPFKCSLQTRSKLSCSEFQYAVSLPKSDFNDSATAAH